MSARLNGFLIVRPRQLAACLVGLILLSCDTNAGPAQTLTALPELSTVKPFIVEAEGSPRLIADLSPIWSQLEGLSSVALRERFLACTTLVLVKDQVLAKHPKASSVEIKLVKVVEYDSYNRPMLATALELVSGTVLRAELPTSLNLDDVNKAASALSGLKFNSAELN